MPIPALLLNVAKELAWSFLAKPVLMRIAFWSLQWAVKQTDNELDDKIVAEAFKRYQTKPARDQATPTE